MTIIENCIEFWTSFVPDFTQRIRGSAAAEIAGVERLMKRPLSGIYREFLERMGEDTGPLDLGLYSASPQYLVEQRPFVLRSLPEGIELFASPTGDDEEDIFLVHGEATGAEVVRHEDVPLAEDGSFDKSKTESVAGSLAELLCLPALNLYHSLRQPFQASYSDKQLREDTLERCRRLAGLFGFEPYWFSNAQTFAARRGNLVIVAKQAPAFVFSLGIAGADEFEFGVVSRALFRELDLEEYR
jgi:hypothetical protein